MDLSGASLAELSRELRRRTSPDQALDAAFDLTDQVSDDRLRALYEVLTVRMMREAEHLPVATAQYLIIERICSAYVMLKQKENLPLGDGQGFATAGVLKEFNQFWLSMTQEFNKQLQASKPSDREMIRRMVQDAVETVTKEAYADHIIEGPQAQELMKRMAHAFDERGV